MNRMKYTAVLLLSVGLTTLQAQNERKIIRQGIKDYKAGNYSDAEVAFRKASDLDNESFEAGFNTAAAMYKQKKYQETVKQFEPLVDRAGTPVEKAHVWHNIGNSLLQANQYGPSIEAYKQSLRLNPDDPDTKYNLSYARKKLKEEDQQQNKQKQQKQDNDQQKQDQQKQDQQEQDQQKQDQQEQEQQQQQQQDQESQQPDNEQDDKGQNQPVPQKISKEDAERMLNAIQQEEKDVKEKVDKQKAAVAKVKTAKDW